MNAFVVVIPFILFSCITDAQALKKPFPAHREATCLRIPDFPMSYSNRIIDPYGKAIRV